jgi:hypothetical protein
MALDKDRGGDFSDAEFLELTKSLFSTFDLVRERSLEFKLNQDKFESSDAKNKIERLIAGIIQAEMNYEKEMEEWESNEKGELEYGTSGNYEDEDDSSMII